MRKFKKLLKTDKFINDYGEEIICVLDDKFDIWIYHNDCSCDYVNLYDFEFILNANEQNFINNFIEECIVFLKNRGRIVAISN